jgi:hypothetical protein
MDFLRSDCYLTKSCSARNYVLPSRTRVSRKHTVANQTVWVGKGGKKLNLKKNNHNKKYINKKEIKIKIRDQEIKFF